MKYYKRRHYDSDCHILEFNPAEYRLDATVGARGKLERLSQINGEPKSDEYVHAKMNGGFFDMYGSTEYIGSFVDEGLYFQGSHEHYPTVYFTKDNELKFDINPDQKRHVYYQKECQWAISTPWTLVVDGKINYTYTLQQLVKWFGHPNARAPRTMMGQKADKTIVLVVADGRSIYDKGLNIRQQADIMLKLGCTIAINLDGGGSSEMIVKDSIVNSPSDRRERKIGTAFMVYGKKEKEVTPENNVGGGELPPIREFNRMGTVIRAISLNVRNKPGVHGDILGTLKKGEKVYINSVDARSGWYLINYKGAGGWVSNNYIKLI